MEPYTGPELKCPTCLKIYKTNKYLEKHILSHTNLTCEICVKTFKNPTCLRQHIYYLHGNRPKKACSICPREFRLLAHLRQHMKSVHSSVKRPRLPCNFIGCAKTCLNERDMAWHFRMEHAANPVRLYCALCSRVFKKSGDLHRHIATHTKERAYPCAICGSRFGQSRTLRCHERTHQDTSSRSRLSCRICPRTFLSKLGLQNHQNFHEGRKYPCNLCHKTLATYSGLKIHIKTKHSGDKLPRFPCGQCEYRTWTKGNLDVHVGRMHGGVKEHGCYFCGNKFFTFHGLVRHVSFHINEK
ncbi:zinc finger protein 624-like [Folsomia candida]|uniref:zinc finger protein 624-like n=1 Tax=Folsomia candida TaxID=158441 RepID=UPI001604B447|nr:zinc finger protein 624-like [Folsomia candida]